ncbi:putative N-acetyltransferase YafP [Rubripirellula amarantea]|uniref:Putative N-acetyltransferase YafP n=1 Tax=Rubripirellula amarantea TaxID=2527999 RepID=A0A5C5WJA6_9BACT|nr:GNAT family N-acetyltransferase [Rubripirellula amarantea]TWT50848.1 putative N-acetyltransferase YafP [Rubripirellula amarantea]
MSLREAKMDTDYHLRHFVPEDGEACWQLFQDTIRRINTRDYEPEQIAAWLNASSSFELWLQRFEGKFAFVVEREGKLGGFADMGLDGYLDRLFVSADHQRRGIATMLTLAIETKAMEVGLRRIYTHASLTARPFFQSRGYQVTKKQSVDCKGVYLTNFVMEKRMN